MAVYVVTGKLGGGKTLACVDRINWALGGKRKVATNLEIRVERLPACSRKSKKTRVVRVPDRPQLCDLLAIGFGVDGVRDLDHASRQYDESRFGVLVLDECGTWLNAREWNEEGRRELIDYLLHIRKYLWDVYLIIQDVSALDKQVRKMLAEHVVYCRRLDRIALPLVGWIGRLWSDKPLTFSKLHVAFVKYGDTPQSLTVDRWFYRGGRLYSAYQTTQVFSPRYEHGSMSMLPPWHLYHRQMTKMSPENVMRITKVLWRRWSRPLVLAVGVVLGVAPSYFSARAVESPAVEQVAGEAAPLAPGAAATAAAAGPLIQELLVSSFWDDGLRSGVIFSAEGVDYRQRELEAEGVAVARIGRCRWRLAQDGQTRIVGCWP